MRRGGAISGIPPAFIFFEPQSPLISLHDFDLRIWFAKTGWVYIGTSPVLAVSYLAVNRLVQNWRNANFERVALSFETLQELVRSLYRYHWFWQNFIFLCLRGGIPETGILPVSGDSPPFPLLRNNRIMAVILAPVYYGIPCLYQHILKGVPFPDCSVRFKNPHRFA